MEKQTRQTSQNRARTGLERFMDKFPYWTKNIQVQEEPEYLGVGAMMISPEKLCGGKNGRRKTQLYSR